MKNKSELVRYSRAGDQFHYLWAARRCLSLLSPSTDLKCITIEGISTEEMDFDAEEIGEEVIDVAEYFGSEKLQDCRKISYFQLKHSTKNVDKPWTLSALKKTLNGFYLRYQAFNDGISNKDEQHADFVFLTNRPVNQSVHSLLDHINKGTLQESDKNQWEQLKGYLSTEDDAKACEFFNNFRIDDSNDGYWQQRNILIEELNGYIPGPDKEGADQLWRLVVEKALPLHAENPGIRKEDVFRVLNTHEEELFLAPCLIVRDEHHFARVQEDKFLKNILSSDGKPIIIHAESGVGKTALARRLCDRIDQDAVSVIYDCFGNGTYRDVIKHRHGHDTGLVQIANELAAQGLCHPLIPSRLATPSDYLKAFNYRLDQAVNILRAREPNANLIIFIDAADNAQMAAEENGERTSFPRDLIRQDPPEGVVFVFFCRTHRRDHLNPPPDYIDLQLSGFSLNETRRLLEQKFPDASDNDVKEFHRLSSQNPRVQATSLSANTSLIETLTMLGPHPTSVEDAIQAVFQKSIDRLMNEVPNAEADQILIFCEALAILRPFIPLEVLALASGMPETAIRSFATDLGRPLSIVGDAVQFFDEPSETWFRETYKPTSDKLAGFIEAIRPLTATNSYVVSAIPQLMLEAGQYKQLVEMVLSDEELQSDNPVDKRNASLQRLQFALKAALREKRYEDAAKLALKAGGETAGDDRQQALIQENTDLVSNLFSENRLREIVAQKSFSASWHGGYHAYEAGILAGCDDTVTESRSYLRLAHRWIHNWFRLPPEERKNSEIKDEDIAEMSFAQLNINGAVAFVADLECWQPKQVAYRVGFIIFSKLVDLGRYDELDRIASASENNLCIQMALIEAQTPILRYPNPETVKSTLTGIATNTKRLKKFDRYADHKNDLLKMVTSVALAAAIQKTSPNGEIASILGNFIPSPERYYFRTHSDEPRFSLLRANCLRAALADEKIELIELARPELRKKLEKEKHYHDQEAQEFLEDVGTVFSWHQFWCRALLGDVRKENLTTEIDNCLETSLQAAGIHHRDDRFTSKEISRLWLEIILHVDPSDQQMKRFIEWKSSLKQPLFTPALTHLARVCGRSDPLKQYAFDFAKEAYDLIDNDRMDADQKVEEYSKIARAVFAINVHEANYYFDQAFEVSVRIGQENMDRWSSLLELASKAAEIGKSKSELAYRLSRCAEVTYDFVARDKYFDWESTVNAMTGLCPTSSPAILSRWRDRGFGWDARIFPVSTNHLVDIDAIDAIAQLGFLGLRYQWKTADLLERALASCSDNNLQKRMFDETMRYLLIGGETSTQWKKIIKIGNNHRWETSGLDANLDEAKKIDEMKRRRESRSIGDYEPDPVQTIDWDSIFVGLDVSDPSNILDAYKRMRSGSPPYSTSDFAEKFFERVSTGKEGASMKAMFSVPDFSLYEFQALFGAIPESWLNRQHLKIVLAEIVKKLSREHFYDITKSRYYQPLPFDLIAKNTGITEHDIYKIVVETSALVPNILGAGRLFSLVGMIAPMLSSDEAENALKYGLGLLEDDIEDKDGDGDWCCRLNPPATTSEALAGYVWSGLASPKTADRWEAAHTVCLLCSFKQLDVLEALSALALGEASNPFYDRTLPFYDLSAKLWLLISLRRTIQKNGNIACCFHKFIKNACSPAERHVMVRGVAASVMLKMNSRDQIELVPEELKRLENINRSKLDIQESKTYDRKLAASTIVEASEEDKYYFGYDLARNWFEDLGKIFAYRTTEIERRALKIIREDWKVETKGGWANDERHIRNLYTERETGHSHGSYPRSEDLSFYHSYHSMMIVAGDLIDTVLRHQDPDYSDELDDWLNEHELTRSDGLWVADRRDPKPTETPTWKETEENGDWPFSVLRVDLKNAIDQGEDKLCVWGDWINSSGDREEHIYITSAFVSSKNSMSLLRAIQTTNSPYEYGIPTSGSELEISDGGYQLKGWIREHARRSGIDEFDPWTGDIAYPPIEPAEWFTDRFDLASDYEKSSWHPASQSDNIVLRSEMWGRKSDENERSTPESGKRLIVRRDALSQYLTTIEMDMVFVVKIERQFRRDSFRWKKTSITDYLPPYTLTLILKADGTIKTI